MFLKLEKNPQAKKNTFETQNKVKKKTVCCKPPKIIFTMMMSFVVLFLMSILVLSKRHICGSTCSSRTCSNSERTNLLDMVSVMS